VDARSRTHRTSTIHVRPVTEKAGSVSFEP
jgi:hypothetical protein